MPNGQSLSQKEFDRREKVYIEFDSVFEAITAQHRGTLIKNYHYSPCRHIDLPDCGDGVRRDVFIYPHDIGRTDIADGEPAIVLCHQIGVGAAIGSGIEYRLFSEILYLTNADNWPDELVEFLTRAVARAKSIRESDCTDPYAETYGRFEKCYVEFDAVFSQVASRHDCELIRNRPERRLRLPERDDDITREVFVSPIDPGGGSPAISHEIGIFAIKFLDRGGFIHHHEILFQTSANDWPHELIELLTRAVTRISAIRASDDQLFFEDDRNLESSG